MSISAIRFLFLSTYIYDVNFQNIALSMKKQKNHLSFAIPLPSICVQRYKNINFGEKRKKNSILIKNFWKIQI